MNIQAVIVSDALDCDISVTSHNAFIEQVLEDGNYLEIDDVTEDKNRTDTAYVLSLNISNFPRDVSECMEDADDYEEMDTSSDDSCQYNTEIFVLSEIYQPGTHDSIRASAPYRVLLTGNVTLPEYCDDESDGSFYGTIAIIYNSDQTTIDKMRAQYRIDAADSVVGGFIGKSRNIKIALKACSYPRLFDVRNVLREYGQIYAARINDETHSNKEIQAAAAQYDATDIATAGDSTNQASSCISVASIIQNALQCHDIPHGDTLYFPGDDTHEVLKDTYDSITNTLANAKLDVELKSVWGIGGTDIFEALLFIPSLEGTRLVISAKDIELQLFAVQTIQFQSDTDQIMASIDPSAFLVPLLGVEKSIALLRVCQQLGLVLDIPEITQQVFVEKLIFTPVC